MLYLVKFLGTSVKKEKMNNDVDLAICAAVEFCNDYAYILLIAGFINIPRPLTSLKWSTAIAHTGPNWSLIFANWKKSMGSYELRDFARLSNLYATLFKIPLRRFPIPSPFLFAIILFLKQLM